MKLDHADAIDSDESHSGLSPNVVDRLADLSGGLDWLFRTISSIELSVFERLEREREFFSRTKRFVMMGNGKQLSHVDQRMVMCAFHWYAVSVCNYARTVGWFRHGPDRNAIDRYVTGVIPAVWLWRNKVAAHYGFTDPRGDNPADFSVFSLPLSFTNEGFTMGAMRVALTAEGVGHASNEKLLPWSLTAVHSQLVPRYWPDGPIPRRGGIRATTNGEFMALSDLDPNTSKEGRNG